MNPLRRALNYYRARRAWLGDGGQPVSTALALSRTATCRSCPAHDVNSPVWESLTAAATSELRLQIELMSDMDLDLPNPPHLCGVCGCHLPTKVWMPLIHARAVTPLSNLPPTCWLLTEHTDPSST